MGPDLSPETIRRVNRLFAEADREPAATLLFEQCGRRLPFMKDIDMYGCERFRFAALKYSDGNLEQLERAVKLAQRDLRDLLMATEFAHDVEGHREWEPKAWTEPSEIDPAALAGMIHRRLSAMLAPLGFERQGETWRRAGEVPQSVIVQRGLTSRIQTKFFLRVELEVKPLGVPLHLPKLPGMSEPLEQGYVSRAGGDPEAMCASVEGDMTRYAPPWFERFTSRGELQKGFEDGTSSQTCRSGIKS